MSSIKQQLEDLIADNNYVGIHVATPALAEIESLRQQLAEAQADRDAIKKEWEKAYEIGMLAKQQLAAAIAACKLKHSALETLWIGTNREEWDGVAIKSFEDAVAIQPDDSALKDWIGEPVAYADPLDIAKDGNWDTFIVKHASECNDTLRFKAPLYSPKGLK